MSEGRFGSVLALVRQGLSIRRQFGLHSLTALISIAETVEESVYERGSLVRVSSGFVFRLLNPPLRSGAFSSLRLAVDGAPVAPERVRLRAGDGAAWRDLTGISRATPIALGPGDRVEFAVDGPIPAGARELTVRLELQSTTIPPLVWFEFRDTLRRERAG